MADDLPPIPEGYELAPSAPPPGGDATSSLPPIPEGHELASPQARTPAALPPVQGQPAQGGYYLKNPLKDLSLIGALKGLVQGAYGAATLPGNVYTGKVDPYSEEGLQQAISAAQFMTPMTPAAGVSNLFGVATRPTAQVTPRAVTAGEALRSRWWGGEAPLSVPGAEAPPTPPASYILPPLTKAGAEARAGEELLRRAENPQQAIEALQAAKSEPEKPVAPLTTFQTSGDTGLGALEREVRTKDAQPFLDKAAEQNQKRVEVLDKIEKEGNPEDVTAFFRDRLADFNRQASVERAITTGEAEHAATSLGGEGVPEGYGGTLQKKLVGSDQARKAEEGAFWDAVDPNGKLAVNIQPIKDAVSNVYDNLPVADKSALLDSEKRLRGNVDALPAVAPFRELKSLRSKISEAMRQERRANGSTDAFRRLVDLRSSVEDALTASVEQQAGREAQAVARGELKPEDTIAGRLPSTGNAVFTPSGRQVGVRYRVVDAKDLTPATEEIQPRDRTRAASDVQIAEMANKLQPERLGASASPTEGAPIVGPDGMVEAGNARYRAIQLAHQMGGERSAAYRKYLEDQGYDMTGIQAPVLVRERTTALSPEERVRFAEESNAAPGLTMSASERAAVDSRRLPSEVLDQYRGGDIGSAENRDFVRAFLRSVPEKGEEGGFVTGEGALSLEGQRRVQNALLHAAYGDSNLVAALAEAGDENLRAFGNVLSDAAGSVAKVRRGVAEGKIAPQADISPAMLEAAQFVQAARQKGLRLADAMAQADAFNPISKEAQDVLHLAYGEDLSGRIVRSRVTSAFDEMAREAAQQTTEARLLEQPLTAGQIIQGAQARARTAEGQPSAGRDNRPGVGAGGDAGGRPGPGEAGASGATARQGGPRVLEQPQQPALQPNFDQAAIDRYAAATAKTNERRAFNRGPMGELVREGAVAGEYNVKPAEVPQKIFRSGVNGHDTVQAFREYVGNDVQALDTLTDYAASSLRRFAGQGGVINPQKFETWRNRYADALRAMPGLEDRLASAARATEAIEDVAIRTAQTAEDFQTKAVAKVMNLTDARDIAQTVGKIMNADDGMLQMRQLAQAAEHDPAAKAGLRRAVRDYIYDKYIGNIEAGTTGEGTLKSDPFQTFVKKNNGVLRQVFTQEEVNNLRAVAQNVQQANRSLYSTKIPAGSNSPQDMLPQFMKMQKEGHGGGSLFNNMAVAGYVGYEHGGLKGAITGALLGSIKHGVSKLRQAGLGRVDDFIKEGLLDPDLGLSMMLAAQARGQRAKLNTQRFRRGLARSAALGAANAPGPAPAENTTP